MKEERAICMGDGLKGSSLEGAGRSMVGSVLSVDSELKV